MRLSISVEREEDSSADGRGNLTVICILRRRLIWVCTSLRSRVKQCALLELCSLCWLVGGKLVGRLQAFARKHWNHNEVLGRPVGSSTCVAMDGVNTACSDGSETEIKGLEPYATEEEYKTLYCHQRADGKWHYGPGAEGSSK